MEQDREQSRLESVFLIHMLYGFARHGLFDLNVQVTGDLEVDTHHTIEDVGIVLGTAIKEANWRKERNPPFRIFPSSYG